MVVCVANLYEKLFRVCFIYFYSTYLKSETSTWAGPFFPVIAQIIALTKHHAGIVNITIGNNITINVLFFMTVLLALIQI